MPQATDDNPDTSRTNRFEHQTATVVGNLRDAFGQLVGALPGQISGAAQLQRALHLDMKLCWKIMKVLDAPSALGAALYVPGPANIRAFLERMERGAAPPVLLERAEQTAREFETLVRRHAGDRRSFDSMVSAWSDEGADRIDVGCRRDAFRANSHIWGLQADAQTACYIWGPARADENLLDGAGFSSWVGLRRLRRTPAPLLSQLIGITDDDDDRMRHPIRFEPVDPDGSEQHGISLIRAYCSDNIPQLRTRRLDEGYVVATLPLDMIGNTAAITLTTGTIVRNFGQRVRDEHNRHGIHSAIIQSPVKVLLLDLLVHDEAFFGPVAPRAMIYADRTGRRPYPHGQEEENLLSPSEPVVYLGHGAAVLETSEVPRHADLARHIFDRLGADSQRYMAFRCRVEYPVLTARVVMLIDLPESRR